jgi:membrane-anchored protein YejM (alkaline phosphatase superfamily)
MLLSESPRRQTVSKLVSWGHWFAFFNIVIALLISAIYVFATPFPKSLLGQVYLGLNWVGHISFITFLTFIILIIPMCYNLANVKMVKGLSSIFAALGLALLAFDALIYTRTGVHVSFTAKEIVVYATVQQTSQLSWQEGVFFVVLFCIWLSFQLLMANALWQRIERFSRKRIGQSVIAVFVACFVASHALHVWADARLYQPIIQQDDMFPLSYPATAKTTLSRYGLLNIENYENRKTIQEIYAVDAINYPKEPLYCPLNVDRPWLVLYATQTVSIEALPKHAVLPHYRTNESIQSQIKTIFYSLPSLYHDYLSNSNPVIFDVFSGFGVPTFVTLPSNSLPVSEHISALTLPNWLDKLALPERGFYFGTVDRKAFEIITTDIDLARFNWILVTPSDSDGLGYIHSNLTLNAGQTALNEDIIPTVLAGMNCPVSTQLYSNGQALTAPQRAWQVTTENDAVVLFANGFVSKVYSNGVVEVRQQRSMQLINQNLDTILFNRSMKHLNQFSDVK